jgi:hypothetical protein
MKLGGSLPPSSAGFADGRAINAAALAFSSKIDRAVSCAENKEHRHAHHRELAVRTEY